MMERWTRCSALGLCGWLCLSSSACAGLVGDPKLETPRAAAASEVDLPDDPAWICDRVVDDFADAAVGAFPKGWEPPDRDALREVEASGDFVVEQHAGKKVLRVRSGVDAVALGHGVEGWDLERYPVLQWRWRAIKLPELGSELDSDKADTAASVQIVWLVGFPFMVRLLKYTFSSTLPPGTRASNRLGHDQVVVLDSGTRHLGKWRTQRVNVRDHYRELYGKTELQAPAGLSIQTDADDTGSHAEAYYADFRLCRAAGAPRPALETEQTLREAGP